jgi:2-methylfumaryl-CoA isomerase
MVVALTDRQWTALQDATGIGEAAAALAAEAGVDLNDAGNRYKLRDRIAALIEPWFAARDLAEIGPALAASRVTWGPYRSFRQLVEEDPRVSTANPMFAEVEHDGIGRLLTPASPLDFSSEPRLAARPAPRLGQNTDEILGEILGLGGGEIGRLHDKGVVAGAG